MSDPDTSSFAGATSTGVDPRLSALLCYTAWWVSGIVFLIIEHQHRAVRFHAAQSLVVFGGLSLVIGLLSGLSIAMLMVSAAAFQAARLLVYLVWMATVGLWLLVMLRTYQGETWRVPIASDLADRIADR
ncbi:MAG TPA: hypothetical protein VNJ02_06590 [Vicinamibacterales bacterium]|nr:hypothetical protein [Vicinamibacterales bacterium]